MDTMNVKHFECFGPCFADEWQIKDRASALKRWNEINLYQLTRGINRFKGLARILKEMYPNDPEVAAFKVWTDSARELSEGTVEEQIKAGGGHIFKKAFAWSRATNATIAALPDEKKCAFNGVYEALKEAGKNFDIAIVSSANYAAVTKVGTLFPFIPRRLRNHPAGRLQSALHFAAHRQGVFPFQRRNGGRRSRRYGRGREQRRSVLSHSRKSRGGELEPDN